MSNTSLPSNRTILRAFGYVAVVVALSAGFTQSCNLMNRPSDDAFWLGTLLTIGLFLSTALFVRHVAQYVRGRINRGG